MFVTNPLHEWKYNLTKRFQVRVCRAVQVISQEIIPLNKVHFKLL